MGNRTDFSFPPFSIPKFQTSPKIPSITNALEINSTNYIIIVQPCYCRKVI